MLITLYGGLLRLDAFAGKYGTLERPGWARVLTHDLAPLGASLRPESIVWKREAQPYVGGDPINYLKFAREMRGFYDAHVREPVFLAITRVWLWALGDQDAAVSFASLTGSTLSIFGAYLLASVVFSKIAGLLTAVLVAIEHEVITWGPDGWRDDTFTAAVVFAAWALLRLYKQPSMRNAVLAGALCGVACLTRITALSFVVPGMLWFVARQGWRERIRYAAASAATCGLVVGPYLISCAIATGDPFYAINYHTGFYLHAEGRAVSSPLSATEYVATKFRDHPVATIDTAFEGLFIQPFVEKWRGFEPWLSGAGGFLRSLALVGLAGCAFFGTGRLFLLLLVTSLVPYMLTWNLPGGNEWRFNMHVYPFYLAAATAVVPAAVGAVHWWRTKERTWPMLTVRHVAWPTGALIVLTVAGAFAYVLLPWYVVREAIAKGESTSIQIGPRDRVFYRDGWSPPRVDGLLVRFSETRSVIRIPMTPARQYEIVLRMDPVDPGTPLRVSVLFNGHFVARPGLTWDAARVGSYRVPIAPEMVRTSNELTIIPEASVAAGSAGPRFAWLDPDQLLGVRFWYVRVLPLP